MKLKSRDPEPLLKRTLPKQTPRHDWNDRRDLIIELRRLGLEPKLERGRIIVSG